MTSLTDVKDGLQVVAGEYYALRQFFIERGVLTGISYSQVMLPGLNKSTCNAYTSLHHDNDTPDVNCTCGWYSFKNNELWTYANSPHLVTAIVKLSGKVVLNEKGYRAEYMEVVARTTSSNEQQFLYENSDRRVKKDPIYDIPLYSNMNTMLQKHPVSDQHKKLDSNSMHGIAIALTVNVAILSIFFIFTQDSPNFNVYGALAIMLVPRFLEFKDFMSKRIENMILIISNMLLIPLYGVVHPVLLTSVMGSSLIIGAILWRELNQGAPHAGSPYVHLFPAVKVLHAVIRSEDDLRKYKNLFMKSEEIHGEFNDRFWKKLLKFEGELNNGEVHTIQMHTTINARQLTRPFNTALILSVGSGKTSNTSTLRTNTKNVPDSVRKNLSTRINLKGKNNG